MVVGMMLDDVDGLDRELRERLGLGVAMLIYPMVIEAGCVQWAGVTFFGGNEF